MAKPLVAIVGRPNVGKSTFFNKIAGRRISIVEDVPGVTRDRIYCDVEWMGRHFSMVDTGGLDMRSEDVLLSQMRRQAEIAMETADVICFFCDGRTGLTPDDEDICHYLRKTHKPILLVVNKMDYAGLNDAAVRILQPWSGRSHCHQRHQHAGAGRPAGGHRPAICPRLSPTRKKRKNT